VILGFAAHSYILSLGIMSSVMCDISFYIISKDERFTSSVPSVEKNKTKIEYLAHFIDCIERLNFNTKILCLDQDFYSRNVFELIEKQNVPHIFPAVRRGEETKPWKK
jgi:putative transposase